MSQRLISVQEEERRRIAGELHDDINQRLSMLAVELQIRENQTDAELASLIKTTQDLVTDVNKISHGLNPIHLQQVGLEISLRNLCNAVSEKCDFGIVCNIGDLSAELPYPILLGIYRITQEALHNARKHSGASHIDVSSIN